MEHDAVTSARPSDALEEGCSDLGNARRLVRLAGGDLRYVHLWGRWLVWDGTRWATDHTGEVERRAKRVVESIALEAASAPETDRRKALLRHALHSEGARAIRNMIALAQSERVIALPPEAFDRDPWALNVENGTLDLRTGTLRAHRREDFITKLVPAPYQAEATCPTFEAFLARIFAGKRSVIEYVQRAVGYSLTGLTTEQVLLVCWGTGANGKTTLMQTVATLLADYAATLAAESLLASHGDDGLVMNDLAGLQGARFVVAVESDMGRRLAEARVKQLTGGEPLRVKRLYADVFSMTPTFKLWLGTNHKPEIRGTDKAIWRRIKLVPFDVVIPDAEQDPDLFDKLRAERPGILRWALQGCLAWQRHRLAAPAEVRRASRDYRAEMDTLGDFIAARCLLTPDRQVTIKSSDLYAAYEQWARDSGERSLSLKGLSAALMERGWTKRDRAAGRFWLGVRLRGPMDAPDEHEDEELEVEDEWRMEGCGAFSQESSRKEEHRESYGKTPHNPPSPTVDPPPAWVTEPPSGADSSELGSHHPTDCACAACLPPDAEVDF